MRQLNKEWRLLSSTNNTEKKQLRIKHSPKPRGFGDIVSDTVERITDGIRDYFISTVDAKMKFALTLNYQRLTSKKMRDFYFRFKDVYPGKVAVWQSDNGGENLGVFDQQLAKDKIPIISSLPVVLRLIPWWKDTTALLKRSLLIPTLTLFMTKGSFKENYLII